MSRLSDLMKFYQLLERLEQKLGGKHTLANVGLVKDLPSRGVYFFFENGEDRRETGQGLRVVRVGTHGLVESSRSTLKQRLMQHRGSSSGGGNHRGSIFRLLIGDALLTRGSVLQCRSWGLKSDIGKAAAALKVDRGDLGAQETSLEQEVSKFITQMSVVWVSITDNSGPDSFRGLIERNSIALLSNFQREEIDAPSSQWLGHSSSRANVRSSGLWNQRHVDENHDPRFLDDLTKFIDLMSFRF